MNRVRRLARWFVVLVAIASVGIARAAHNFASIFTSRGPMSQLLVARAPRLASCTLLTIRTLAAVAIGSMPLLGASSPARASAEPFASLCAGCHNNVAHPTALVNNVTTRLVTLP